MVALVPRYGERVGMTGWRMRQRLPRRESTIKRRPVDEGKVEEAAAVLYGIANRARPMLMAIAIAGVMMAAVGTVIVTIGMRARLDHLCQGCAGPRRPEQWRGGSR